MKIIFESSISKPAYTRYTRADHDTEEAAKAVVEAAGSGTVTKFLIEPNRPGLWPVYVSRSLGHQTFEDGAWRDNLIHQGDSS